jgi:AraC-like DNA-binding protein
MNERMGALFQKIFVCWVGKKEGYYFRCISLLYEILAQIQKTEHRPTLPHKKIQPAVDAILNGFLREELSVGALADRCGISESYFKRLFKEKYGISPKRYIIQLKINHACDLLRLSRYSISQIAEICNFSDVYFFSRQFKQYMGISPSEFTKQCKPLK